MRILVTGGGGFLGSHLVERLQADGHDVVVPRRSETDLTDMTQTARLFAEVRPELVYHLAAEVGGIGANRANPGRYWYANLMMGAHVLEQARLHETRKVVMAGTVCAYPKFTPVPFREDDLWNGYPEETNAPYGVAKKALLVGAGAYREQYGLDTIFLLPTNLYGPRDNFDLQSSHVIPALIRKMIDSPEEIVLWGDGTPTREYLYVDDCVEGLRLAAERYDGSEPVNLGTGVETSIRETAEIVAEAVGFTGKIEWDTSMPNGQPRRSLDPSRAAELFGFRAQIPLREGIARTVAWYRAQSVMRPGARSASQRRCSVTCETPHSRLPRSLGAQPFDLGLQQRQPLGEHGVLVVELGKHRRVVEQDDDDEERRDGEQDRRRIRRDTEPACDGGQPFAPGREDEQDHTRHEPQERISLLEPAPADQLEDDQDEDDRRNRGRDRDPYRSHALGTSTSSLGTVAFRSIAMKSASVTFRT